jgi:hypothetical protein
MVLIFNGECAALNWKRNPIEQMGALEFVFCSWLPNGWRYPLVGGARQRHFAGINFKPRKLPENAVSPTSRVHAVLGALSGSPGFSLENEHPTHLDHIVLATNLLTITQKITTNRNQCERDMPSQETNTYAEGQAVANKINLTNKNHD